MLLPIMISLGALTDIYGYIIPNILSIILIIGFYLFAFLHPNFTSDDIINHTLSALLVLSITFTMFAFGFLGGGDAKLLATSSLWFGFGDLSGYIFYVTMAGGILSMIFMVWRRTKPFNFYNQFIPLERMFHGPETQQHIPLKKRSIPYAVGIMLGFYFYLPHSKIFIEKII